MLAIALSQRFSPPHAIPPAAVRIGIAIAGAFGAAPAAGLFRGSIAYLGGHDTANALILAAFFRWLGG
jgi:Na+/glutamate symporter